jgi:ribonuclease HI
MQNIIIPFNRHQFKQLLQNDEDWGIALQGYTGEIKYHLPRHPLIEFAKNAEFVFLSNVSKEPLQKALLLFTDGSSNGRAVVYRENHPPIIKRVIEFSAQQAEITAVILALKFFPQAFNLYTDSKYVTGQFPAIETALLSGDSKILKQLQQLQSLIQNRKEKFFIGHIRRHTRLPGPLSLEKSYSRQIYERNNHECHRKSST